MEYTILILLLPLLSFLFLGLDLTDVNRAL